MKLLDEKIIENRPFLWPVPMETVFDNNKFSPGSSCKLFVCGPEEPAEIICEQIVKCGFEFEYKKNEKWFVSIDGLFNSKLEGHLNFAGSQGYMLRVTDICVAAFANTQQGLLYALQTLEQLGNCEEGFRVSTVFDKPNALNRGVMIDLARVPERPDYVISLLPLLSSSRINQLYFNIENKLEYKSHPLLSHPLAWSQDDMRRVVNEAKKYFIEVVPIPSTIGHMESILKHEEYTYLAEPNTGDHLAIYKPEARKFIAEILEEICSLFPGEYVHLAGDEAPYLGKSLSQRDDEKVLIKSYADGVNFMADCVMSHGKQAIIWADMVLHYPELMNLLNKDIILLDWHYGRMDRGELTSPEKLMRGGFKVGVAGGILADEPFLPTLDRLEGNLPYINRRTGVWGSVSCMWEPRTQTLPVAKIGIAVAGACSWNPFNVEASNILSTTSMQVYGVDISEMYKLLSTTDFYDKMAETKMGYYHCFEFSCSHPLVHKSDNIDPFWLQVYEKMENGLELLDEIEGFQNQYSMDYNAFRACGMLGKCLAGWVVLMGQIKDDQQYVKKLDEFADFVDETLDVQHKAWNATRFEDDDNFNWWFSDSLKYKSECLKKLAREIEDGENREQQIIQFDVNKGDASTWNLLRMKILFSDDQQEWKQMFFKTVPLWMAEGVSFSLMPKDKLPKWMKIKFSCWTWYNPDIPWKDILKLKILNSKKTQEYKIKCTGADEMLLMLR